MPKRKTIAKYYVVGYFFKNKSVETNVSDKH